jgi:hypothetical protein
MAAKKQSAVGEASTANDRPSEESTLPAASDALVTSSSDSEAPVTSSEASAPDEFRAFMIALATDPAQLGKFIKDPDAEMQAAGISDVDRVILKSGHSWTINARLSGQRFSFTPSTPSTPAVLVVDMVRAVGAPEAAADQPSVRSQQILPHQGSSIMFPNSPSQIFPQQIFPIHPQQIFPQIHPQQIFPIHPQQIFPQIHPQQIFPQQIFPQIEEQ